MASGLHILQAGISRNLTRCIKHSSDKSFDKSRWRFLTSFAISPGFVHDSNVAEEERSSAQTHHGSLINLKEREKGDWRNLSLEEKQALYRMSFSQPFHVLDQPADEWKLILASTFTAMGLMTLGMYMWNSQLEKTETVIGPLSLKKEQKDTETFVCHALHSFKAEEENELSFEDGDILTVTGLRSDGWWEAKNASEVTGLVPSTFLKVPDNMKSIVQRVMEVEKERKAAFPNEIQSLSKKNPVLLSENQNTSPKGFRPSKLFEEVNKSSFYSLGSFMVPKLDDSGLSFRDIQYEEQSGLLKPNPAPLQRKISLIAARHILEPPKDYLVRSRHIRMCFHDGNKVLSNIHTVKAKWNESSPRLWMFNLKMSLKDSCAEDGEIFIKSDKCVPTLGILFELCISYEQKNGIINEMCAGWVFMKLLNDSGDPVKSKTVILKVQDTVPFAAYLSHLNSPGKLGLFKKIIDKQKVSRIVVSISNPDRASNHKISYFPSTLIGPWSCISLISLCRKITADDLLKQNAFDSTEGILSPLLACIPVMLNEADLLDTIRVLWTKKMKNFDSDDMRVDQRKKKAFQDLFLRTIFVMLNTNGLPTYVFGDSASEKARKLEIDRVLGLLDSHEGTLALSAEIEFSPLSLNKLSTRIY